MTLIQFRPNREPSAVQVSLRVRLARRLPDGGDTDETARHDRRVTRETGITLDGGA
jgi:hypothetical protein